MVSTRNQRSLAEQLGVPADRMNRIDLHTEGGFQC